MLRREVKISTKRVKQDQTRVNKGIRATEVRVIGSDGGQIGVLPIAEALRIAESDALDLVEVSPEARPPVCKIMDHGKYKYELTKKKQEAKRKQKSVQIKEIKVRPKTDDHDLETKARHMEKFISNGDKVKITLVFRGREFMLKEQANIILEKIVEMSKDFAQVEQLPKFEGRFITMLLGPK
ncbi:MAG: translation initiation factor IF-3 [Desulfobacter postgatei]|uniref:translation initiation factor IF-3 n=1 Tax=Desulfobacter postgatei TaxID=2293 RepID=UPI0023F25382|nr:translation initiation factor IF-3 [Desulfobacter postgatei]MDD4272899.1 translation initiation factor IF-3 [Desulfobacter postgatei]